MQAIKPVVITEAMLTSSTVLEPDTATGEIGWVSTDPYVAGDNRVSTVTHKVYQRLGTGSAKTIQLVSASIDEIRIDAHGIADDVAVRVRAPSGGTIPGGLSAATTYYKRPATVNPTADYIKLSLTPGGAAVDITSSGSGTLEILVGAVVSSARPEADTAAWGEVEATNRWRFQDEIVSSKSARASSIQYVITPGVVITGMAVFGLVGSTITYQVHNGGTQVYTSTQNLDGYSLSGWAGILFAQTDNIREAWFTGMATGAGYKHTITVNATSGNAEIGEIVMGSLYDFGLVAYGSSGGIRSKSRVEENDFGREVFTRRANAKKTRLLMTLTEAEINRVYMLLTDLESVPCAWRAVSVFNYQAPLTVYGWYGEFDQLFETFGKTTCTLDIKGRV